MPQNEYDNTKFDRARLWLYKNKYWKNDKHPSLTGPGEISRIALRRIVDAAKSTDEAVIRLRCASWDRTSRNGNTYTYVTIEPEERQHEHAEDAPKTKSGVSENGASEDSDPKEIDGEIPF